MSENTAESEPSRTPELETKEEIKRVADFLLSRKGMPTRKAVEMGKRVQYFKGERLCSFLMENPNKSRYCPPVPDKNEAIRLGRLMIQYGFVHRSERDAKQKRVLNLSRNQTFSPEGYYTWMYEGSKTMHHFLTAALIIGFVCITCFPIWPFWAKLCLWYISVTLLALIMILVVVRMVVFLGLWMAGVEFWLLPNVFDDTLSVVDSFRPLYTLQQCNANEKYYRIAAIILFITFCAWVRNQSTDFDEYMALTRQFSEDVYSGKMLAEISQRDKEDIDKPKVIDLEELMREEENDELDKDVESEKYMGEILGEDGSDKIKQQSASAGTDEL